jgi:hypothetical protein
MTTAEDLRRHIEAIKAFLLQKQLSQVEIEELSTELKQIEARLTDKPGRPRRDILELDGLGMELWRSIDVDAYLRKERDSWR